MRENPSYLTFFPKLIRLYRILKANTTIDVIRKNILSENFEYNIYDTPGFLNLVILQIF